jgi:hypothetical protein
MNIQIFLEIFFVGISGKLSDKFSKKITKKIQKSNLVICWPFWVQINPET